MGFSLFYALTAVCVAKRQLLVPLIPVQDANSPSLYLEKTEDGCDHDDDVDDDDDDDQ